TITLPGVGSYIAKANDAGDWKAIGAAILTMAIVILLYDQLLFRPIVAWADKFKVELSESEVTGSSWVLNVLQRTYWVRLAARPVFEALRSISLLPIHFPRMLQAKRREEEQHPSRIV